MKKGNSGAQFIILVIAIIVMVAIYLWLTGYK